MSPTDLYNCVYTLHVYSMFVHDIIFVDTQSYVLNFHGRVTQASVKNFQIVHDNDGECRRHNLNVSIFMFITTCFSSYSRLHRHAVRPRRRRRLYNGLQLPAVRRAGVRNRSQ